MLAPFAREQCDELGQCLETLFSETVLVWACPDSGICIPRSHGCSEEVVTYDATDALRICLPNTGWNLFGDCRQLHTLWVKIELAP